MNYAEWMVLGTPLLVAFAGIIIAYLIVNLEWTKPTFKKDPRWKNKKQIVDFIAWSIIVSGTLGAAILGVMLK